jgi:hypothetical protein
MTMRVYCSRCRNEVDPESFIFWQNTAWCNRCRLVVGGSFSKVPGWVVTTVWILALRLQIAS